MLLYSICYYYGKNKTSNIIYHLDAFAKVRKDGDLFILNVMIDSHEQTLHDETKQILSSIIKSHIDCPFVILTSFNWGGTIVGLWMAYQYGKESHKDAYIAHFEEDFLPHNVNWFIDSVKLLEANNIYVGECIGSGFNHTWREDKKYLECKNWIDYKNRHLRNPSKNIYFNHAVWTEGGFYFSKIDLLKQIDNKIGIFHKGNQESKWNHDLDGIELGEVGFPTLLFHNGFTFSSLYRSLYFKHG